MLSSVYEGSHFYLRNALINVEFCCSLVHLSLHFRSPADPESQAYLYLEERPSGYSRCKVQTAGAGQRENINYFPYLFVPHSYRISLFLISKVAMHNVGCVCVCVTRCMHMLFQNLMMIRVQYTDMKQGNGEVKTVCLCPCKSTDPEHILNRFASYITA